MRAREGYKPEMIRNQAFTTVWDYLAPMQANVLGVIRESKSGICNEDIALKLGTYPSTVSARVNELRKLNLVQIAGEGVSSISGRKVTLWKMNDSPVQVELFVDDRSATVDRVRT